jgi:type I restriction enzyme, S subunit
MSAEGKPIGELLTPRREKAIPAQHPDLPYIGLEHVEAHTTKLLGSVPATEMKSTANRFCTGDVLYSRLRPYLNKVWHADRDGLCSSEFIVLPGNDSVDANFLRYRLNSTDFVSFANSLNAGDRPRVDFDQISSFCIIPFSLPEQRRIVAEIEKQLTRLEAGVAALRRVQANLKRYRAAVLKAACEGRLVPTEAELAKTGNRKAKFESGETLLARILTERRQNWQGRGKYTEPAAPDTRNVAQVAEDWTWASVDQLAEETMIGLDRGRAQQSDDPATGIPYIKMNNVTMDGRVHCDELVFVPASREEATRFAVQDGDILFNTRNSKELVGKVGLVRNPPVGAIYNNNLMRIRVPTGVSQAFLALQMCSHEFRQRMELVKKATTSVAAVYSKDLLPLAVALPPLAEQTRIVAEVERRLSVVEELESVVTANLQRATRLRQSILQKAFTGKLI